LLEEKKLRTEIDHEVRRARAAETKNDSLVIEREQMERTAREKAEEQSHIEESVGQARSQLSRIQAEKSKVDEHIVNAERDMQVEASGKQAEMVRAKASVDALHRRMAERTALCQTLSETLGTHKVSWEQLEAEEKAKQGVTLHDDLDRTTRELDRARKAMSDGYVERERADATLAEKRAE
jgi:hypothetical protein